MHLKPLTWSQKKSCQTKKRVFVGIKPPNFKILFILFCSGKWSAQPQLRQSREKAMMLIFNYGDFCTEGQTGLENFVWICDNVTLRENCPNLSFFLSVFSFIWTKYRKIRTRSNFVFRHFLRGEVTIHSCSRLFLFWKIHKVPANTAIAESITESS